MDESEIESLLRSNAPGKWEQIKKAASIAQEHRRRVKGGDLFIFLFPLAAAMAKDAFFDFIPVLGTIFGVFITVYLFIFMWGRGRIWLRFVFFIIAVLDLIPFINLIPFNTASVVYAFLRARKDATQSQAALSDMERQAPRLKRKLQTQTARMARATALQEERMRIQAAAADNTVTVEPLKRAQGRVASAPQFAPAPGRDTRSVAAAVSIETGRVSAQSRPQAGFPTSMTTTPHPSFSSKPQMVRSQLVRSSATGPVSSPQAHTANDSMYARGSAATNEATLRIRAAGERLSQPRNQGHSSVVMRLGPAPSEQSLRRAA